MYERGIIGRPVSDSGPGRYFDDFQELYALYRIARRRGAGLIPFMISTWSMRNG